MRSASSPTSARMSGLDDTVLGLFRIACLWERYETRWGFASKGGLEPPRDCSH
jgi:hypothetical protein